MSMGCETARQWIIDSLDRERGVPDDAADHLTRCQECAEFARVQQELDVRMVQHLTPPRLPAGFRNRLDKRIERGATHYWPDTLPDIAHVASWGAATALCAIVAPVDAGTVAGLGVLGMLSTYGVMTMVRNSLDDAESAG
jgi:hypothetical protein